MFYMERLSTNTPLDKIIGNGIEIGAITNIFGPAGAGKSNIALKTVLNCKNKVIFIDTEGSFSLERFYQLGGNAKRLNFIVMIEPKDWKSQHCEILKLKDLLKREKFDLIVVDSMVALYRLELNEKNYQEINRQLATQYAVLSTLAREFNLAVLITNQIYSKGEETELTSKSIARYWSKCLIELKRLDRDNARKAIVRKHRSMPEGRSIDFEITQDGLKEYKFKLF